jgi:hypothetical protein
MREEKGPCIRTELMEFDIALSGINLKIRNSVSNGKAWHFECKKRLLLIDFETVLLGE